MPQLDVVMPHSDEMSPGARCLVDRPDSYSRSFRRRLTAYHEAGHAVMAHLCGQRITGLELSEEGDLAGACTSVRLQPVHPSSASLEVIEQHIRSVLAGMVAEARISGRGGWDEGCADLDVAVRLTMRLVGDCERVLPYLEATRAQVEGELAEHWDVVEALADELLIAGSLNGPAARAILERYLPEHSWQGRRLAEVGAPLSV